MSLEPVQPQQQARRIWHRPLIMIPGGLVVVLAMAAAALLYAPPTGLVVDQLVRIVRDSTGRELKVTGDAKLTLYPKAGLTLQGVSVSAPPGAVGADLVRVKSVDAEFKLLSLLRGQIELSKVSLVQPAVTLRPEDRALLETGKTGATAGKTDLLVRELVITDGSMNYVVKQPNPRWRIDQLSATFADVAGDGQAKGSGVFRWRDAQIKFTTALADARAFGRGVASPLDLKVDAKHFALDLKGELSPQDGGQIRGALATKVGSLRDFVRWLDVDLGPHALMGPATLEGPITANPTQLRFDRARFKLDAGESTLDTQVRFADVRPQVTGSIVWNQLDLDKLLGETPKIQAVGLEARAVQPGTSIPSAWQALGDQLAALRRAPGLAIGEKAAGLDRNTWSLETFNWDALTTVDLNLTTTAEVVTHGAVQMRQARSEVLLADGRLTYTLKHVEIDKGRATGRFEVDSTAKPAKVALSVSASDIAAGTLLAQLFETNILAGTMKFDVVVTGRGLSTQELTGSLEGTANLTIEKGRLIGFDLRRALLEWWRQWTFDPARRTNFDRIAGSYGIRDGVVRSIGDLSLTGPEIEIKSSGTLSLSSQTLSQKLRLTAFPPPQHLPVPLRVDGSWTKPNITWDWLSVFQNPSIAAAPIGVSASPEPIPPELKSAIRQLLESPEASQLPQETRSMLQALGG